MRLPPRSVLEAVSPGVTHQGFFTRPPHPSTR